MDGDRLGHAPEPAEEVQWSDIDPVTTHHQQMEEVIALEQTKTLLHVTHMVVQVMLMMNN